MTDTLTFPTTVKSVAEAVGLSPYYVRKAIAAGYLRATLRGRSYVVEGGD